MRQNHSTEVEATIDRLVNRHLPTSHTYLSLAFFVHCCDEALEGMRPFFLKMLSRITRVPSSPENAKVVRGLQPLPGGAEAASGAGAKTQEAMEAA